MAHLNDLVVKNLSGETSNYAYSTSGLIKVEFKQTYEVEQDNVNFKWKVKSALYVRLVQEDDPDYGGIGRRDIYLNIGGNKKYLSTGTSVHGDLSENHFSINRNTGVTVNGNVISSDAWTFTKILENEVEFTSDTGRLAMRLNSGYVSTSGNDNFFEDYSNIYLTLPEFSGMWYKINGARKEVQPWIKVNGQWKKVHQYIKVNGQWKKSISTWIWDPTS